MSGDRFEVSVTFDERRGYVASAPELRQPVVALSLGGIRRRIEAALLPSALLAYLSWQAGWMRRSIMTGVNPHHLLGRSTGPDAARKPLRRISR
jgi:hypothetical protein